MRKTLSVVMAFTASLLLVLSLSFSVVQLCAGDYVFFEEQFIELELDKSSGISVSDLSQGLRAMVQYMNGHRDSIDVDIMLKGQQQPMFALEIEHVHMEEVRTLWQGFISFRTVALVVAVGCLLLCYMLDGKRLGRNLAQGYLWALGLFLLLCFFAGIWAGTNFDSFWTLFHRIAFPGSDNWLLPYESRMIQMLPSELFAALVGRIGLYTLSITLLIGLLCLVSLLLQAGKLKTPRKHIKQHREPTPPSEEPPLPEQEGPDLLTFHKLHNTPVSQRGQLEQQLEEQRRLKEQKKQQRQQEQEDFIKENPDRVEIHFAPFEANGSEEEAEEL